MAENEKITDTKEENTEISPGGELDSLREELESTKDILLRTAAEYENFRKRSAKEKEALTQNAKAMAVGRLLPVIDSLENALKTCENGTAEELLKGIELVYKQSMEAFEALGAEEIAGAGEAFDPEAQHAVSHIESPEFGENTVSLVMQKGYRLGDIIIRPAMVQVAN